MEKVFAGSRVRRLREQRGLSQVELARALVLSASYLNQIDEVTLKPRDTPIHSS